jgi:hypothetical protein
MRLMAAALAFALFVAVAAGCTSLENTAEDTLGRGMTGSAPVASPDAAVTEEFAGDTSVQPAPSSEGATPQTDRMIIRSKTLRLEVESTPEAVDSLRALVAKHAGVITNMQVATDTEDWLYRYDEYGYTVGDGAALRGWMTVRVPAEELETFVDGAIGLGTVKYQAEDTEDVTQQHVDLAARLEKLKAEEVRLRSFFDAANDVQDMLAIEAELNRIRQEIESLDAQVKYLERQAAMATVTIELTEERPVVRPEGDSWGFSEAITAGFRGAANVLTFGIAFLIATAPLWVVALIAFFIVRAIVRSRRKKRDSAAASTPSDEAGV